MLSVLCYVLCVVCVFVCLTLFCVVFARVPLTASKRASCHDCRLYNCMSQIPDTVSSSMRRFGSSSVSRICQKTGFYIHKVEFLYLIYFSVKNHWVANFMCVNQP